MPRQMPVPPPVISATRPASAPSRNTSRGLAIARSCTSRREIRNHGAPALSYALNIDGAQSRAADRSPLGAAIAAAPAPRR